MTNGVSALDTKVTAVSGVQGIPSPFSGGYSVVYEVNNSNGSLPIRLHDRYYAHNFGHITIFVLTLTV